MDLRVLGCFGRLTPQTGSPGFLVDGQLLVDGGTIGSALDESDLAGVRWLVLSHAHLDHVKELPSLLPARHDARMAPLTVAGLPDALDSLRRHVFNGVVWPDFAQIGEPPALRYLPLEAGRAEQLGPYQVTAIDLNHPVRCAAFAIEGPDAAFAYVTDTRATDAIWQAVAANPRIHTVVIDISFPDRYDRHAELTGHYSSSAAAADVRKIRRDVDILTMHMHPKHAAEIFAEVQRLGLRAELMEQSAVYVIADSSPLRRRTVALADKNGDEKKSPTAAGAAPVDSGASRVDPSGVTTAAAGWSFAASKRSESDYLVVIHGEYLGRRYEIGSEALSIGRSHENTVQLADDNVSRFHCRLAPHADGILLYDRNSTNGTYVNGKAVTAHVLRDGEQVSVGRNIFKFLSGANVEHAYHQEIYRLMTTDNLTGAYNRSFFEREFNREMRRFFRYGRPVSLLMIDIDHFKELNDGYGHLAGDRVLAQLGLLVARQVRAEDTFCRWGGEEFVLLMPEMGELEAGETAERLRAAIAETPFVFDGEKAVTRASVSVSIGVAQATREMHLPQDLVEAVDQRLYEAKRAGRNRVFPPAKCLPATAEQG
jgi:diguanylate cyclase (GGDEF)-like protein